MRQDQIFFADEGDHWFQRNREYISSAEHLVDDFVLQALAAVTFSPRNVLEIGAGNGFRLDAIHHKYGCSVTGIEPSAKAIADGLERYGLKLFRGVAHELPSEFGNSFDLVIMSGVFMWIDRSNLLKSVSEVDRVLIEGGNLIISDFAPPYPQKAPYHHRKDVDVFTYKQDYGRMFLASGLYISVMEQHFDHSTRKQGLAEKIEDRWKVAVLNKKLDEGYVVRDFR